MVVFGYFAHIITFMCAYTEYIDEEKNEYVFKFCVSMYVLTAICSFFQMFVNESVALCIAYEMQHIVLMVIAKDNAPPFVYSEWFLFLITFSPLAVAF